MPWHHIAGDKHVSLLRGVSAVGAQEILQHMAVVVRTQCKCKTVFQPSQGYKPLPLYLSLFSSVLAIFFPGSFFFILDPVLRKMWTQHCIAWPGTAPRQALLKCTRKNHQTINIDPRFWINPLNVGCYPPSTPWLLKWLLTSIIPREMTDHSSLYLTSLLYLRSHAGYEPCKIHPVPGGHPVCTISAAGTWTHFDQHLAVDRI